MIKKEYESLNSSKKIILTTEKDYVRLSNKITDISFLGIQTSFLFNQENVFNTIITTHIQQNQR